MKAWFSNLKIGRKLQVTVGAVLAGTAMLGLFTMRQMAVIKNESGAIARDWLAGVECIGALTGEVTEYRMMQLSYLAARSDSARKDIADSLEMQRGHLVKAAKAYQETMILASDSALFREFTAKQAALSAQWPTAFALVNEGAASKAEAVVNGPMQAGYEDIIVTLDKLIKLNHDESNNANDRAIAAYRNATISVSVAIALCIVFGLGVSWAVGRAVSRDVAVVLHHAQSLQQHCIASLRRGLDALALGDTSAKVEATTKLIKPTSTDEIGEIAATLDEMILAAQGALHSFVGTQRAVTTVVGDTQKLVAAAQVGVLTERSQADQHAGAFRELVVGVNSMLDAIAAPLDEAQQVLAAVADRDLTVRMHGEYDGTYLALKTSINSAVENVSDTLTQVSQAAEQVSSAGSQITGASQSLAEGAAEQAASLEEIAASTTEFASMTMQTAANTKEALALAEHVNRSAVEGKEHMLKLTSAVHDIEISSRETAKIMKTIEEIAFQTNLLALNAAVEAARAGDAGRGFAVVADEVRSLAIRSADASKTTAELIERGLRNAQRGVTINAEMSASLELITSQVAKVTTVVAEIEAASANQSLGVQQINASVEQLNGATQQVAANAEESAATAEELASQSRLMHGMVSEFTLHGQPNRRGSASRKSTTRPASAQSRSSVTPSDNSRSSRIKTTTRTSQPFGSAAGYDQSAIEDSELLAIF